MSVKKTLVTSVLALSSLVGVSQATAVTIGTFNLTALVDQVTSFTGTAVYNGVSYIDPVSSPGDITDNKAYTFVSTADFDGYRNSTLGLGFSASQGDVVNGAGTDLALFFLSDQTGNSADVIINGITQSLIFSNVYDSGGIQQVVDGVVSNGTTFNNVLLQVAEVNLDDFGIGAGGMLGSGGFDVALHQGTGNSVAVSLALVGATNVTVVPVPAAVWLFGSGLVGLAGIARRKRA